MRTIILDDNYRIESSENQWTLKFEKIGDINPTTQKPIISKNEFFHNSLQNALKSYIDKKLKVGEDISIDIQNLNKSLDSLLKKAEGEKLS